MGTVTLFLDTGSADILRKLCLSALVGWSNREVKSKEVSKQIEVCRALIVQIEQHTKFEEQEKQKAIAAHKRKVRI